jgi:hypothetical protein
LSLNLGKLKQVTTYIPLLPMFLLICGAYTQYTQPTKLPLLTITALIVAVVVAVLSSRYDWSALFGTFPAVIAVGLLAGSQIAKLIKPAVFAGETLIMQRACTYLPACVSASILLKRHLPNETIPRSKPKRPDPLDIKLSRDVIIPLQDRFLHTFIVGTTGTGKTSCVLKPMIWQDLQNIKKGKQFGITVVEPKGDFAHDVAGMCRELKIPYTFINPLDPASPRFNPLEGTPDTVAIIMLTVLRSLFGRQEAFFRMTQEQTLIYTIQLLKRLHGNTLTISDMADVLRNPTLLRSSVEELERREGPSAVTEYFRHEVLSETMKDKMTQFTLGLRLQLEQITSNPLINRVLSGKSDVDLDDHLSNGGVLIVNTAMGELGTLGDVFGQFVIMQLQQAVFRRPGNEWTRPPHFLYIDEFSRYVNSNFERLLSIGRSFRCGATLALQTTFQMKLDGDPTFKQKVLDNCRNKIVFNLEEYDDAKYFAGQFGSEEVIEKNKTYSRDQTLLLPTRWSGERESLKQKERFTATDLMELPRFHAVIKHVVDGWPQVPRQVKMEMCPYDKNKKKRVPEVILGRLEVDVPLTKPTLDIRFKKKTKQQAELDENFFGCHQLD